jgi:adenosylmethionine-8-amino-7-oxononanoate aminotransferase
MSTFRSNVFHRSLRQEPAKIVSGSGITFTLSTGETVIDASAGPAVSCLGHQQPSVTEAVTRQMNEMSYVYSGSAYTSDPIEELASELLADAPGGLVKAIFVNSGSEATDAALKLASQYWVERGQPQRTNFIARKQSYHGNTLGALSASGHASRRAFYECWLSQNVTFVDPCYAYRAQHASESTEEYVRRLKVQLEDEILRLGPDTVAGFIAETIPGTTLGCVPPEAGYFQAMQEVCDKYDILLILDEIMCGMGKTGKVHAWEWEGIRGPDIQTIGKALGGGFIPLSGVLTTQKVFEAIANGSGTLVHGHTFQAHPTACAAAIEVQRIVKRDSLLENVRTMGELLDLELRTQLGSCPFVGNVRGRGLFHAVEFMRDPKKKVPFLISDNYSNRIVEVARSLGLNILGNLGDTGKYYVELVIISPPYIVNAAEIKEIVQRLKAAIAIVDQGFEYLKPCIRHSVENHRISANL